MSRQTPRRTEAQAGDRTDIPTARQASVHACKQTDKQDPSSRSFVVSFFPSFFPTVVARRLVWWCNSRGILARYDVINGIVLLSVDDVIGTYSAHFVLACVDLSIQIVPLAVDDVDIAVDRRGLGTNCVRDQTVCILNYDFCALGVIAARCWFCLGRAYICRCCVCIEAKAWLWRLGAASARARHLAEVILEPFIGSKLYVGLNAFMIGCHQHCSHQCGRKLADQHNVDSPSLSILFKWSMVQFKPSPAPSPLPIPMPRPMCDASSSPCLSLPSLFLRSFHCHSPLVHHQ